MAQVFRSSLKQCHACHADNYNSAKICAGCGERFAPQPSFKDIAAQRTRDTIKQHQLRKQAAAAAILHADTGMGVCPKCGSKNLSLIVQKVPVRGAETFWSLMSFGCVLSFLCIAIWPVIPFVWFVVLIAAIVSPRSPHLPHYRCAYCRNTWLR